MFKRKDILNFQKNLRPQMKDILDSQKNLRPQMEDILDSQKNLRPQMEHILNSQKKPLYLIKFKIETNINIVLFDRLQRILSVCGRIFKCILIFNIHFD